MKYIIIILLLIGCSQKRDYTVKFIKDGNTTYLLNSRPLTLKEAKEIAKGFDGLAEPVLFKEKSKPH